MVSADQILTFESSIVRTPNHHPSFKPSCVRIWQPSHCFSNHPISLSTSDYPIEDLTTPSPQKMEHPSTSMPFSVPNKNGKTSIPRNPHPLPSPISPIPEHPISASTKGTFSTVTLPKLSRSRARKPLQEPGALKKRYPSFDYVGHPMNNDG